MCLLGIWPSIKDVIAALCMVCVYELFMGRS
jgi:hypothetical protein